MALWEGLDPALGINLIIRTQGTCNSITAYEQAVSRLPARRQAPAAGVLVHHLHREVTSALAADLAQRGLPFSVQVRVRLIENDEARVAENSAGESNALALTTRELMRIARQQVGKLLLGQTYGRQGNEYTAQST